MFVHRHNLNDVLSGNNESHLIMLINLFCKHEIHKEYKMHLILENTFEQNTCDTELRQGHTNRLVCP